MNPRIKISLFTIIIICSASLSIKPAALEFKAHKNKKQKVALAEEAQTSYAPAEHRDHLGYRLGLQQMLGPHVHMFVSHAPEIAHIIATYLYDIAIPAYNYHHQAKDSADAKAMADREKEKNELFQKMMLSGNFQKVTTLKLPAHTERINSININNETNTIITGSSDSSIKIWDIDKQCTHTLYLSRQQRERNPISFVQFCKNSPQIILQNRHDIVVKQATSEESTIHLKQFECFISSPDGSLIATTQSRKPNQIIMHETTHGKKTHCLQAEYAVEQMAINTHNTVLLARIANGTVVVYNLTTKQQIHTLRPRHAITDILASPDGTHAITQDTKSLKSTIWNLETGIGTPPLMNGLAAGIAHDGSLVTTQTPYYVIHLQHSTSHGMVINVLSVDIIEIMNTKKDAPYRYTFSYNPRDTITSIATTENESEIILGTEKGMLYCINMDLYTQLHKLSLQQLTCIKALTEASVDIAWHMLSVEQKKIFESLPIKIQNNLQSHYPSLKHE